MLFGDDGVNSSENLPSLLRKSTTRMALIEKMNVEGVLTSVGAPNFLATTSPVVPSETSHLVLSRQELWDQLPPALKAAEEMNATQLVNYYKNEGNSQPAGSYQFTKSRKPHAIVLVVHKGGTETAVSIKYEWTDLGWIRKSNDRPDRIMGVTIYYSLEGILNDAKFFGKLSKIQSIARESMVKEKELVKETDAVIVEKEFKVSPNENDPLYPLRTADDFFKYLDVRKPELKADNEINARIMLEDAHDGDCVFIPSAQAARFEKYPIKTHAVDIIVKDCNSKNLYRNITIKRQSNLDYWYAETQVGVIGFNNLENILHFARFNDVYIYCHGKQIKTVKNGFFPHLDEMQLRQIRAVVLQNLFRTYFPRFSQTKILGWFCPMRT